MAVAQLQRRGQLAGPRRAEPGQPRQRGRWQVQQGAQRTVGGQQFACGLHRVAAVQAGAEEDRQQFGVGQHPGAASQQLLPGAFLGRPFPDVHVAQIAASPAPRESGQSGAWGKLVDLSRVGISQVIASATATLAGQRILLCVGGGIAAYKALELVRRLRDAGAQVQVAMTAGAQQFVTPLSFQALSGYPARTTLWDSAAEQAMGHLELARWADQVIVAPATADLLARLAHGMADDLVSTLCLATEAPLSVAPAMNHRMWRHPATVANVALLQSRGVQVIGPDDGPLAEGESGPGRLAGPEAIVAALAGAAVPAAEAGPGLLQGLQVVVTAGPTYEDLDPVRYLGNRSSGKMGFAVAASAARQGAEVVLVAGPVQLPTPPGVRRIDVRSAAQMREA